MKKLLLATTAAVMTMGAGIGASYADEVKLGILIGFTGPIESLTGPMAAGAEMAIAEVTLSNEKARSVMAIVGITCQRDLNPKVRLSSASSSSEKKK